MNRDNFDLLLKELHAAVVASTVLLFPLDEALKQARAQDATRVALKEKLCAAIPGCRADMEMLVLFDSTSVGAAIAVKRISAQGKDQIGITTALADLWGQAEAARSLWYEHFVQFPSDLGASRGEALLETARLLGPSAVAIAIQISEPVVQYVEFVSKVAGSRAVDLGLTP